MKVIYIHHAYRDRTLLINQEQGITEDGKKEAEIFSTKIETIKDEISAIYSSSYRRCVLTAEIINEKLEKEIILDERLNEKRTDEEKVEFLNRNIEFLNELKQKHGDEETVVCVTSGVNLTAFICAHMKIQPNVNIQYVQALSCSPVKFEI